MKRLYKSRTEKMIFGVCGGLAKYFEVDVAIVRLLFVLGVLMAGWGVPAYIIAAIVIPEEPKSPSPGATCGVEEAGAPGPQPGETLEGRFERSVEPTDARKNGDRGNATTTGPQIFGYILILIGAFFLARQFMPPWLFAQFWWLRMDRLWPLVFVAIGIAILVRRSTK